MKLRLHWTEKYEVVRQFPSFELDSQQFPALEMEMLQVYNAGSLDERNEALNALEHKMHHTPTERGETIFEMIGPYEPDKYLDSKVHPLGEAAAGHFQVSEDE